MRGKASLVVAPSCVLVLLPGTLTSLAATARLVHPWSAIMPGSDTGHEPAVSHRLYRGTDRGFPFSPGGWDQWPAAAVAVLRMLLAWNSA